MREKALEIDNMLFGIQGSLDGIADAIYNQNAIRSRELKGQGFNIGVVRAKLKEMIDPLPVAPVAGEKKPIVVCLCGSTRFKEAFDEANYQETMAGRIVLSVGFYMHAAGNKHGDGVGATPEQKEALDILHKRKIDLADEVLVLNVGGYIGSSTRSEINHAMMRGKPVRFLETAEKGR